MFRSLFFAPTLAFSLIFVLLQQGTVASSTWFLSQITANSSNTSALIPWLTGFLLSLTLPYIPGVCAVRQVALLKNFSQQKILDKLREVVQGKTTLLNHKEERERRFVFLQREGEDFVNHACDAGFDFTQTFFNITLNILALITIVNVTLLPAYLISLCLMLVSVRLGQNPISRATREQRDARVDFESVRLKTWENLTIGNPQNSLRWNSSLNKTYKTFSEKRLQLTTWRELASLLSTWAAMAPVLAANIWLMIHAQSVAEISLLIAVLPRQLMVLNHLHIISSYSGFFHELRERFSGLEQALSEVSPRVKLEHDSRIRFSELNFDSVGAKPDPKFDSHSNCLAWVSQQSNGRYRLTGRNGSGKSTLLRSLKESLSTDAFYLPAEHAALDFPVPDGLSSGQRSRAILESLQKDAPRVLLLDEWDANLDSNHRASLDNLIAQLSERHLILEVRHL